MGVCTIVNVSAQVKTLSCITPSQFCTTDERSFKLRDIIQEVWSV